MRTIFFFAVALAASSLPAQSIVISSGGGSIVVSSSAQSSESKVTVVVIERSQPKPITIDLPEIKEPVTSEAAVVGSTERAAEDHLRNVHGIAVSGLSLQEMEIIHDKAHGGSGYHFPGRPSMVVTPTKTVTRSATVMSSSRCPGGVCPTRATIRTRSRRR